jgi:hypothetical protein
MELIHSWTKHWSYFVSVCRNDFLIVNSCTAWVDRMSRSVQIRPWARGRPKCIGFAETDGERLLSGGQFGLVTVRSVQPPVRHSCHLSRGLTMNLRDSPTASSYTRCGMHSSRRRCRME